MSSSDSTTVASANALKAALSAAKAGDTILLEAGDYGSLSLRDVSFGEGVTIAASDPEVGARFSYINLNNVEGLTFRNVTFDYDHQVGSGHLAKPFSVTNSREIAFKGCIFDGDLASGTDSPADGAGAGYGLVVRDSAQVSVADSEFHTFYKAITVSGTDGFVLTGSEVHEIRSDGLGMASVRNVLIEDNHFHTFREAEGSGDHWDMIQLFSLNQTTPSTGITVRQNFFDMGEGTRTQTIWMRNEEVDKGRAGDEMFYRDVTIEDNLIVNGHRHGIAIGETDGLTIANNTLLRGVGAPGEGFHDTLYSPAIVVAERSTDVAVTGNVANQIYGHEGQSDWTFSGNIRVQDHDPAAADFITELLVNPYAGEGVGPSNYALTPEAKTAFGAVGAGWVDATDGQLLAVIRTPAPTGDAADPLNLIRFDASLSHDAQGRELPDSAFRWHFDDGSTATGRVVEKLVASPGHHSATLTVSDGGVSRQARTEFTIDGPDVLSFDAASGMFRVHEAGADRLIKKNLSLVDLEDGGRAVVLGEHFGIGKNNVDRVFGSDNFSLRATIRGTDGARSDGELLRLHTTLQILVNGRGELVVKITPDGGSRTMQLSTSGARLTDDEWHDIGVDWDGESGRIALTVDGEILGTGSIFGALKPMASWDLMIGTAWSETFVGEMSRFSLGVDSDRYDFTEMPVEETDAGDIVPPVEAPSPDEIIFDDRAFDPSFEEWVHEADHGSDGTANIVSAADSSELRLTGSGHLNFGDLDQLAEFDAIAFSIQFSRHEADGSRGRLVWNHNKIGAEVVGDRLKLYVGTGDGTMYHAFTDPVGLNDVENHVLTVMVDAELDELLVILDGEVVHQESGVDFDLSTDGGIHSGWTIGSPWNAGGFDATVSRFQLLELDGAGADDFALA